MQNRETSVKHRRPPHHAAHTHHLRYDADRAAENRRRPLQNHFTDQRRESTMNPIQLPLDAGGRTRRNDFDRRSAAALSRDGRARFHYPRQQCCPCPAPSRPGRAHRPKRMGPGGHRREGYELCRLRFDDDVGQGTSAGSSLHLRPLGKISHLRDSPQPDSRRTGQSHGRAHGLYGRDGGQETLEEAQRARQWLGAHAVAGRGHHCLPMRSARLFA